MKYYKLNDGNKIPALGLGTYKITNREDIAKTIEAALENGYEYIDTAKLYENEDMIGAELKNSGKKEININWQQKFGQVILAMIKQKNHWMSL